MAARAPRCPRGASVPPLHELEGFHAADGAAAVFLAEVLHAAGLISAGQLGQILAPDTLAFCRPTLTHVASGMARIAALRERGRRDSDAYAIARQIGDVAAETSAALQDEVAVTASVLGHARAHLRPLWASSVDPSACPWLDALGRAAVPAPDAASSAVELALSSTLRPELVLLAAAFPGCDAALAAFGSRVSDAERAWAEQLLSESAPPPVPPDSGTVSPSASPSPMTRPRALSALATHFGAASAVLGTRRKSDALPFFPSGDSPLRSPSWSEGIGVTAAATTAAAVHAPASPSVADVAAASGPTGEPLLPHATEADRRARLTAGWAARGGLRWAWREQGATLTAAVCALLRLHAACIHARPDSVDTTTTTAAAAAVLDDASGAGLRTAHARCQLRRGWALGDGPPPTEGRSGAAPPPPPPSPSTAAASAKAAGAAAGGAGPPSAAVAAVAASSLLDGPQCQWLHAWLTDPGAPPLPAPIALRHPLGVRVAAVAAALSAATGASAAQRAGGFEAAGAARPASGWDKPPPPQQPQQQQQPPLAPPLSPGAALEPLLTAVGDACALTTNRLAERIPEIGPGDSASGAGLGGGAWTAAGAAADLALALDRALAAHDRAARGGPGPRPGEEAGADGVEGVLGEVAQHAGAARRHHPEALLRALGDARARITLPSVCLAAAASYCVLAHAWPTLTHAASRAAAPRDARWRRAAAAAEGLRASGATFAGGPTVEDLLGVSHTFRLHPPRPPRPGSDQQPSDARDPCWGYARALEQLSQLLLAEWRPQPADATPDAVAAVADPASPAAWGSTVDRATSPREGPFDGLPWHPVPRLALLARLVTHTIPDCVLEYHCHCAAPAPNDGSSSGSDDTPSTGAAATLSFSRRDKLAMAADDAIAVCAMLLCRLQPPDPHARLHLLDAFAATSHRIGPWGAAFTALVSALEHVECTRWPRPQPPASA